MDSNFALLQALIFDVNVDRGQSLSLFVLFDVRRHKRDPSAQRFRKFSDLIRSVVHVLRARPSASACLKRKSACRHLTRMKFTRNVTMSDVRNTLYEISTRLLCTSIHLNSFLPSLIKFNFSALRVHPLRFYTNERERERERERD